MLKDAIHQARNRRAVYVVAIDESHKRILEKMAGTEAHCLGIKFETVRSLPSLDLRTINLVGSHPNCVVLVDHHALESFFAPMLEMLHRYDNETMQEQPQ